MRSALFLAVCLGVVLVSISAEFELHKAAKDGNSDLVKTLVEEGANVNEKNENFYAPLHIAVAFDHLETAKTLIELRANINSIIGDTGQWYSPLYTAVNKREINVEMIKLLIDNGADVNFKLHAVTDKRWTCLYQVATEYILSHEAETGSRYTVAKMLIERGADVNAQSKFDWESPLHVACAHGSEELIKLFIENGASINIHDKKGEAPLYWAVSKRTLPSLKLIKFLVKSGSDLSAIRSALNYASHHAQYEIRDYLEKQKEKLEKTRRG